MATMHGMAEQRTPRQGSDSGSSSSAALRPSILLVDDDVRNLKAVTEILADLDAELVCAGSGSEAFASSWSATLPPSFSMCACRAWTATRPRR